MAARGGAGRRERNMETELLSLDRIVELCPAPEFFITRVGYIEKMPGPCMRLWCCEDHSSSPGLLEVKAKVIFPLEAFLGVRKLITAWGINAGLFGGANAASLLVN